MNSEVEAARDSDNGSSSIGRLFLSRRILLSVVVVLLATGILIATSRATTSVTIPDLVGQRVDPQLVSLRVRLGYNGLALNQVSTVPCSTVDLPGISLEPLPGTIVDQHPAAGTKVTASRAMNVTVCVPP